MTTVIFKAHMKSALIRPVFLIFLVIALLLAPASAFAGGDDSPEPDNTPATEQDSPVDQSGGFEVPAPAETFNNPVDFEQDLTGDFSVGNAGFDSGTTDPDTGPGVNDGTIGSDTSAPEQELEPPETTTGTSAAADSPSDTEPPAVNQQASETDPSSGDTPPTVETEAPTAAPQNVETEPTTTYFQVAEVSMSPLLNPGAIIEIVSTTYADGDMVVAQTSDGKYVVKMLVGDQLVPLSAGASYSVADVTILGAAGLSSMTAESLEQSGLTWNTVLGETHPIDPVLPGGSGTNDNPYQIASLANLYWITAPGTVDGLTQIQRWDKYYLQTVDINATVTLTWNSGYGWVPIGSLSNHFTGSFDGGIYTISNLYINRPSRDYVGLFGYCKSATLQNIKLEAVNITGKDYVGGLVGSNDNSKINNCYATGNVTGTERVGGLVGNHTGTNSGPINKSYAKVNVTGTKYVGGLVGHNSFTITDCYAEVGAVKGTEYVGGLTGNNYSYISNSHASGTVEGEDYVGGLVGYNYLYGTISNSHASGTVEGKDYVDEVQYSERVGGLVGSNIGQISDSHAEGAVSGYQYVGGLVGDNSSTGTISKSHAYGAVTTIPGLLSFMIGGLVGENYGNISDSHASGAVTPIPGHLSYYIGGLVGGNYGNISNSSASGTADGYYYIGGLVGENHNAITNSYAVGKVTGLYYIGGLVGLNSGTISNSYASGAVDGYEKVGGLVGYNRNTISNCYASGDVTGIPRDEYNKSKEVGGLVGSNNSYETIGIATISNCYATGSVVGNSSVGGLVGYLWSGTISNSYWDTDTSGQVTSAGGTGKTTIEMKDITTFSDSNWIIASTTGYDPDGIKIWYIKQIEEDKDYPKLYWQYENILKVIADDKGITYNQAVPTFTATFEDFSDNVVSSVGTLSLEREAGANAGSYTITPKMQSYTGNNHLFMLVPGTLTINKADATIVVTGTTVTYDGNAHGASGTAKGVEDEDLAGLNLGASFTNVPGGTANWTFTDTTGNYNDDAGSVAIVINKADATISVNGSTVTYNDNAHGASGTAKGVKDEDLAGLNLGASFTDVPGGTANWTFTDTTGNYNDDAGSVAIVINKANAAIVVTGTTVTYNGNAHGASGAAKGVKDEDLAGLNLGASFTNVPGGTANWVFTDVTGNYNNHSGSVAIVINQAPLTVTANSDSKVYDATAYFGGNGVIYAGFVSGEDESVLDGTLNYSGSSQGAVNVGAYVITPEGLTSGNYAIFFVDGRLEITRVPLTITTNDDSFTFDTPLLAQQATGLTTITGRDSAVISPNSIAYGSWNDLYQATAAYQAALARFENNGDTLSPAELAMLEVELAMAKAALLAMEARLLASDGLPYNLATLQAAYAAAAAALSAQQGYLSADQLAAANQLLAAIAAVISALQYGVT